MAKVRKCKICSNILNPGDLVMHKIVPDNIATQTGILNIRKVALCSNCSHEIQIWYNRKVYNVSYDEINKRFKPKSSVELVSEYKMAYKTFVKHKKLH